jgi:hypothetical protein
MTFHVAHQPNASGARSPFRIVETQTGHEVDWINQFLDRECVRCLAPTTLRAYAMDLLHFVRWWASGNHTDAMKMRSLPCCRTMCDSRSANNRGRRPPASIDA